MTTEQLLIDYFARRGVVLTKERAKFVIKMVRDNIDEDIVTIVKHKFNGVTKAYEKIRTLFIPAQKVKEILSKAPRPIEGFYKYTFADFDIKEFYTVHPSLFD